MQQRFSDFLKTVALGVTGTNLELTTTNATTSMALPSVALPGIIDYANPVTLSGNTVLGSGDMGKQFYLTGSTTFTTTLPASAGNLGKQIAFLVPNGNNQVMYELKAAGTDTIDGATSRLQWEDESKTLVAIVGGWTKIATNTRKLGLTVTIDPTTSTYKHIPNGDGSLVFPQVQFPLVTRRLGPPTMVFIAPFPQVSNAYFRIVREGSYVLRASFLGTGTSAYTSADVMLMSNDTDALSSIDPYNTGGGYNYGTLGAEVNFASAGVLSSNAGFYNGATSAALFLKRGALVSAGLYVNGTTDSLNLHTTPLTHISSFNYVEDSPW